MARKCECCGKPRDGSCLCRSCGEQEIEGIQESYVLRGAVTYTESQRAIRRVCAQAGLDPRDYGVR